MTFAVPVVDIAPYVTGTGDRAATAAAMDAACRDVGFVQVVGHGVDPALATGLAAAMDAFFGLPPEEKATWRTPPEVNRGYSPPRSESLSLSLGVESATRMNDFFEAFNVGAAQSDYPHAPGCRSRTTPRTPGPASGVPAGGRGLVRRGRPRRPHPDPGLRRRARAAGRLLRPDDRALPGRAADEQLRLPPGAVELDGELTGMGEHTDYGIVTVLWADQVPGLQVLGDDGGWHDVAPADGALLVNLGDVTTRLTNERWRSTLHRVKPPVVDGTIRRRRSAAFFHDGDVDAVVAVLPSCLGPGEEPMYLPVTVGEHVAAKLRGSRAGVVNTAADREAARVLAARG